MGKKLSVNKLENQEFIVRTNITGLRGNNSKPTFFEWLYSSLIKKSKLSLFSDFYTSTISSDLLANMLLKHIFFGPKLFVFFHFDSSVIL